MSKYYLILGGTGAVGEGIAKKLVESGNKVVVPVRNNSKEEILKEYLSDNQYLHIIEGSFRTVVDAKVLRKKIFELHGVPDVVIASLGGWWRGGRITELPMETWDLLISNNLTSHYIAASTFLPEMAKRNFGRYIMINGAASETPLPFSGPISILAAAQKMMSKVLEIEHYETGLKFNSLVIMTPVITRARATGKDNWVTAEDIGNYIDLLVNDKLDKDERDQNIHHIYTKEQALTGKK